MHDTPFQLSRLNNNATNFRHLASFPRHSIIFNEINGSKNTKRAGVLGQHDKKRTPGYEHSMVRAIPDTLEHLVNQVEIKHQS